jgi:hypothetical protein
MRSWIDLIKTEGGTFEASISFFNREARFRCKLAANMTTYNLAFDFQLKPIKIAARCLLCFTCGRRVDP